MTRETLAGGGFLVALEGGGLAVEGVTNPHRGLMVAAACSYLDGERRVRATYRLTRRVVAGTDLWHVRRADKE